jgi:hypothetical protein
MEDESANEMDSNHPPPSHHHLDPILNDSRKRTNHQTENYHTSLRMADGIAQQTVQQQQNFLSGFFVYLKNFNWLIFIKF